MKKQLIDTSKNSFIIRPNYRFDTGIVASIVQAIMNLYQRRDMIVQLFKKEFFAGYKKSFLGSFWIIVSPIVGIVSWVFLHRAHILQPGNVGISYPAYILAGTLIWGLFMDTTSAFMNALSNARYLLLWSAFPHEVVFGVQFVLLMVRFAISFVVTLILLAFFHVFPSVNIIFFPFVLLPLIIFAMAVGGAVSVISVVSLDVRKVILALMGLLMFVTPVIYSSDAVTAPWLRAFIQWNPLTYLVGSARDCLLYGTVCFSKGYLISTAIAVVGIMTAWRIFFISEDKIIERMI